MEESTATAGIYALQTLH